MQVPPNPFPDFAQDESGAATTDWVVLTGMLVGLALATTQLVFVGSEETTLQLTGAMESVEPVRFTAAETPFANYFYDIGIAVHPDSRDDAWREARQAVHDAAPSGYEYDPGFTTTRYVDMATGYPIYVSEDGLSYSIGGQIVAASAYDTGDRMSFRSAFNSYFEQN